MPFKQTGIKPVFIKWEITKTVYSKKPYQNRISNTSQNETLYTYL